MASWAITSPRVQIAATALLASAALAFADVVANSGIDPGLASLQSALVVSSPAPAIAAAVTGFCQAYSKAVIASWLPFDDTQSSRGPQPVNDGSYGLSTLATWGDGFAAVAQDGTSDAAQMQSNQNAIIALVQGCAITGWCRISARTAYTSQQQAQQDRDEITWLIGNQALTAADAGKDATFAQWKKLAQAVSADLTARGKQVPNVVTYLFNQPRAALALAQIFYQDATRAGELIARNAAPLPLFIGPEVEALAD